MSTTTPIDLHPPSGSVLTHPAFDRPAVHNERRPGRKKGTCSLDRARRERGARRIADELASRSQLEHAPGQAASHAPLRPEAPPSPADPWKFSANDLVRDPLAPPRAKHEDAVIAAALAIIEVRMQASPVFEQPQAVKDFMCLHLAGRDREALAAMFLDTRCRLLAFEVLFTGTLTHTPVHPREVVRRALQLNAAGVILAHNHPSGVPEPSRADELVTAQVRHALHCVDVRLLDHVVVAGNNAVSMGERGLL